MRVLVSVLLAALSLSADEPNTPVLVELFTSEGCSSCPAADALASKLHLRQPIDGVEIIVLSEHVDYWNRLGWTDRFSSPQFTRRQNWYSMRWPTRLYTPQTVVDGLVESVGSDAEKLLEAIRKTGAIAKAAGEVRVDRLSADIASITVSFAGLSRAKDSTVRLAVVEDALASDVARGENQGRRLEHTAVVRSLDPIGKVKGGQTAVEISAEAPLKSQWTRENLRLVAFVQEDETRAVVGIAVAALEAH